MTFDEFLALPGNQAEFDRRMTKGIDTAVSKESSRLKAVFDQQLDEQTRMSKMTDAEKAAFLEKKRTDDFARREADLTRRELTASAKDSLASKGLPIELADILVYTDQDACNKSIERVEATFNKAVQDAVDKKLKGKNDPPKDGHTEGDEPKTDTEKARAQAARIAGVKI